MTEALGNCQIQLTSRNIYIKQIVTEKKSKQELHIFKSKHFGEIFKPTVRKYLPVVYTFCRSDLVDRH